MKGFEDALARAWPDGQSQSGAQCRGDSTQKKFPSEISSRRFLLLVYKCGLAAGVSWVFGRRAQHCLERAHWREVRVIMMADDNDVDSRDDASNDKLC